MKKEFYFENEHGTALSSNEVEKYFNNRKQMVAQQREDMQTIRQKSVAKPQGLSVLLERSANNNLQVPGQNLDSSENLRQSSPVSDPKLVSEIAKPHNNLQVQAQRSVSSEILPVSKQTQGRSPVPAQRMIQPKNAKRNHGSELDPPSMSRLSQPAQSELLRINSKLNSPVSIAIFSQNKEIAKAFLVWMKWLLLDFNDSLKTVATTTPDQVQFTSFIKFVVCGGNENYSNMSFHAVMDIYYNVFLKSINQVQGVLCIRTTNQLKNENNSNFDVYMQQVEYDDVLSLQQHSTQTSEMDSTIRFNTTMTLLNLVESVVSQISEEKYHQIKDGIIYSREHRPCYNQ